MIGITLLAVSLLAVTVSILLEAWVRGSGTPSVEELMSYRKHPYWKRPWETITEYHIRVGDWRGDDIEHVVKMIAGSESLRNTR